MSRWRSGASLAPAAPHKLTQVLRLVLAAGCSKLKRLPKTNKDTHAKSWRAACRAAPTFLQGSVVAHCAAVVRVQTQPVPHCIHNATPNASELKWCSAAWLSRMPSPATKYKLHRLLLAKGAHPRVGKSAGQCLGQSTSQAAHHAASTRTRVWVEAADRALHYVGCAAPPHHPQLQRQGGGSEGEANATGLRKLRDHFIVALQLRAHVRALQ